jgi:hypothetical protein
MCKSYATEFLFCADRDNDDDDDGGGDGSVMVSLMSLGDVRLCATLWKRLAAADRD